MKSTQVIANNEVMKQSPWFPTVIASEARQSHLPSFVILSPVLHRTKNLLASFNFRRELFDFLIFLVGAVIVAFSVIFFSWAHRLVSGGTPGYALVISYLTNLSLGVTSLLFNGLIFLLGFLAGGVKIGIRSLVGFFIFSLLLDLLKTTSGLVPSPVSGFSLNLVYNSFQALLAGIGVALIVSKSYSVGAFGTLVLVVQKYWPVNPANFFFFTDFLLTVLTAAFFGFQKGLFLLVNAFVFFFALRFSLIIVKKYVPAA